MSNPLAVRKIFNYWPCLPVFVLCALAFSGKRPGPVALSPEAAYKIAAEFKLSDTMVAGQAGSTTLRGQLRPSVQVRGEAPLGGRVVKVLVKPGQQVRVGDPVMQLEGQIGVPGTATALRQQVVAEGAQVDAARQQEIMQIDLAHRQEKLMAAQERVHLARERVAQAREAVRRVAGGQSVSRAELAALGATQLRPRLAARGAQARNDPKLAALRTEAQNSAAIADAAGAKADKVRDDAIRLGETAMRLKNKLRDAQSLVAKIEERMTKGLAKPSEAEAAQIALKTVQQSVQDTSAAAEKSRLAATQLDRDAEKLRIAAARDAGEIQKLTIAAPTPIPVALGAQLSSAEVGQLAEAALEESEAAAAEAERLRREIKDHSRQVRQINSRLSSTSNRLEDAQINLVESKIAEKLEAVRAPATGVVLQVAATSLMVTQGETLIAIGAPDRLEIRLADETQFFRGVKTGDLLPAIVQVGTEAAPVSAEVREIWPPLPGVAATIVTTIENPLNPDGTRRFRTGLTVECVLKAPVKSDGLTVPADALINKNQTRTAAVLIPVGEPESALFKVEWREVATTGDGPLLAITGGLEPGERIARHPDILRELLTVQGTDAVVRLTS